MRAGENDCHVAFRLPREEADRLRGVAADMGVPLSALLRDMCRIVLSENPGAAPIRKGRRLRKRPNPFLVAQQRCGVQTDGRAP